ncbi:SDR family oxidoreductase [Aquimarina agarivorans]|uniref:SDR family oxidoreductase n=1 Tax=Aquimarina agarivorans TaxID=980584 RepID=UPI000248E7FE|nr:NmrA family NAD(P)-binding protein [Aquimarina agarivorans]
MNNKVFVTGATGFQGMSIAKSLINAGDKVITLSRSLDSKNQTFEGIDVITGSLENEADVSKAMKNANKAVFTCPLVFDLALAKKYVENFIKAAEENHIELVVYNSSFDLPEEETGLISLDIKVLISDLFKKSALKVINLVPDIYLDNASAPWSVPVIVTNKIFPYPVESGKKLPWISHSDLGNFTASAINKPELAGKTLSIGGNLVSGQEIADAISEQLGEQISFVSITPDAFQKELTPAFGELAGKEISNLYRYIETNSNKIVNKNFKETQQLLGHTNQSLSDWAKSIDWKV